MTHAARLAAIKRLRRAAEKAIGAPEVEVRNVYLRHYNVTGIVQSLDFLGTREVQSPQCRRLEAAWRAFPECERDEAVPPPHEILTICERMEREQAADDEFIAALRQK